MSGTPGQDTRLPEPIRQRHRGLDTAPVTRLALREPLWKALREPLWKSALSRRDVTSGEVASAVSGCGYVGERSYWLWSRIVPELSYPNSKDRGKDGFIFNLLVSNGLRVSISVCRANVALMVPISKKA